MPDRLVDDPTIPPPGRRNGEGSASILPYLVKTLASKPMAAPPVSGAAADTGQSDDPQRAESRH